MHLAKMSQSLLLQEFQPSAFWTLGPMVGYVKYWPLFTGIFILKQFVMYFTFLSINVNRFRTDHGWRRMDFTSPSRMDRHIEMMMAIEKSLIQAKCLVQPIICIMPEVDKGIVGKLIAF